MRIGMQDMYATKVGNQAYLREQYGMSAKQIAEKIVKALNNG